MNFIKLGEFNVAEERQRKEVPEAHITELKRSILNKGLLHAPVLYETPNGLALLAGGCRLRAMRELHEEHLPFHFNGQQVPAFHIPFARIRDLDPIELEEAELEENVIRANLTFLEEAAARSKIHELRRLRNPNQTIVQTAQEINSKVAVAPGQPEPTVNGTRQKLAQQLLVAQHLNNPKVLAAKNLKQASRAVLDDIEAKSRAALIERGVVTPSKHKLLHGDCLEILSTIPINYVDCIITDPPYGISADVMKREAHGHWYEDGAEYALKINKYIIERGFEICKREGNLFLFCDIEHFVELRDHASRMAWSVKRTPLIWRKGETGHAPWGREGFARTYEIALYAVKGQKGLYVNGGPDSFSIDRVRKSERAHAAEKPAELFRYLLAKACLPGDVVLDPCCGSGPVFDAASQLSLQAIGIEKSRDYHQRALIRMADAEQQTLNPDKEALDELFDIEPLEDEVDTGESYEEQAHEEGP